MRFANSVVVLTACVFSVFVVLKFSEQTETTNLNQICHGHTIFSGLREGVVGDALFL